MNLLRYTARECPPDFWRYKHPGTGHVITEMDKGTWLKKIEEFHLNNGFELVPGWQALAEHELCMMLEPGFCRYEDGSAPTRQVLDLRTKAEVIVAATKVFKEWIAQGRPAVSQEVAEQRGKTCAACYASVPIQGCGGCVGLIGMVLDVVGTRKISAHNHLLPKACAWCKCSALANAWMPVEVSEKGVTDEMLNAEIPHCWKIREIRELRENDKGC